MIGHDAVRTNPHRSFPQRLAHDPLERLIILGFLEQLHTRNAPVEDMKHHSAGRYSCSSRHGRRIITNLLFCQYRTCPVSPPAWVSAIIHQHGRAENQAHFAKVHRALVPGGTIGIRDFVMSADRTQPPQGALFAVNMLANTERGDTFSFDEIAEDLQAAGFVEPQLRLAAQDMNAVVVAKR